jgi:beta-barrel assembly-enhancing protease
MFKNLMPKSTFAFMIAMVLIFSSCKRPFLISIDEDIALGRQVAEEISNNPEQYPMLNPDEHTEAYQYLNNMFNEILNTKSVEHREKFPWQIRIIHDDNQLNAFAAPGGFIYVYTGLIKYLDKADDLAGVLGHEIAHSDRRHTSRQLERLYGLQMLLGIALGQDPGLLSQIAAQIAGGLTGLAFSRGAEREADEYSVIYLAEAPYACNAAYTFFQKLIEAEKAGQGPAFLSTHPNPENRVEDINKKAQELNCSTQPLDPPAYQKFKEILP